MNPSITQYPGTIPGKGQSQTDFDANVDDFLSWLADTHAPELQAFGDWSRDIIAAIVLGRLPDLAGRAGSVVRVKNDETGVELSDDVVKVVRAGQPLPTTDVGVIFHPDYNSLMTWQVFDQNGANYAGYASIDIGMPSYAGQAAARAGCFRAGGGIVSTTTYAALAAYARHHGLMRPVADWGPSQWRYGDIGNGTMRVPDVRGDHFRNWDQGRGVDPGRGFGAFQPQQMPQHQHAYPHVSSSPFGYNGIAVSRIVESVGISSIGASSTSGAIGAGVGAENRVRTIALPVDIKF